MKKKQEFFPEAKFKIGETVAYTKRGSEGLPSSIGSKKREKGFEFVIVRIAPAWLDNSNDPTSKRGKFYLYFPKNLSGFYEYELESRGKSFEF